MQQLTDIIAKAVTAAFCALLAIVLATGSGLAQDTKPLKGVALVIGLSAYSALPRLPNTAEDARAIADVLGKLGLATDIANDSKSQDLRRAIDGFIEKAQGTDVAIVYYAGHAIELGGTNYLLPTDTDLNALEAADQTLVSLAGCARKAAPESQDHHPAGRCFAAKPLPEICRGPARQGFRGRADRNNGPRAAERLCRDFDSIRRRQRSDRLCRRAATSRG